MDIVRAQNSLLRLNLAKLLAPWMSSPPITLFRGRALSRGTAASSTAAAPMGALPLARLPTLLMKMLSAPCPEDTAELLRTLSYDAQIVDAFKRVDVKVCRA